MQDDEKKVMVSVKVIAIPHIPFRKIFLRKNKYKYIKVKVDI